MFIWLFRLSLFGFFGFLAQECIVFRVSVSYSAFHFFLPEPVPVC